MSRERRARNEALFREVNERIRDLSVAYGAPTEFLCECGRPDCMNAFPVPLDVYESVRAHELRFLVRPDHVDADLEVVVEQNASYAVVEKVGAAADAVEVLSEPPDSA